MSEGAGPKLKAILQRGVGVHHAGVLPRYRRMVEELFERKLLSVCVCTETLAAGINLPARAGASAAAPGSCEETGGIDLFFQIHIRHGQAENTEQGECYSFFL